MGKNVDYITVDDDKGYDNSSYTDNYETNDDDFPSMFMKLCSRINVKVAIFVFVIGLFIFSDIFVRSILGAFNNAVGQLGAPTSHGTVIQLLFIVFGYIVIDLLVQSKYI